MLVTPRGLRVNIYSDIMYFDMIWYSEVSVLPWLGEREPGGKSPSQAFFEGSFLCQIFN